MATNDDALPDPRVEFAAALNDLLRHEDPTPMLTALRGDRYRRWIRVRETMAASG